MIVNLDSSGFDHMMLHIHFEADLKDMKGLCESRGLTLLHPHGDDLHYSVLGGFRKGGLDYRVRMQLIASGDDGSSALIEYRTGKVERPRARRANLNKVGAVLDDLSVACSVNCIATGEFPSDRFKPIISLPLLQFNTPFAYFDEIRGVRLVRTSEGVESDVAIDVSEEDSELQVFAQTTYSATLGSHVPAESLARLTELRLQAVTEVLPDSQE